MATITIKDLHTNRVLDRDAMSAVRGAAGAPWVFGWIRPYVETAARSGAIVNFYQTNNIYETNNIYVADQMNNQIQVVDISNAAANANITVHANQRAGNVKQA